MTIEQIKQQLNILDVLAYYNLQVNANKHINCPFHEDKTPSMRVYEETNTVYCFSGNCSTHGKSHDVIEFVMKQENCSKHEAILKCKTMILGCSASPSTNEPSQESAFSVIWVALKKSLQGCEKAKDYLKSRGLSTANVGYHSGQLNKGKLKEEAELCGLLKTPNKAWEVDGSKVWARECVIFPLLNATGKVVSFYGRSLTSGHYYQAGRCGLYPSYPSPNAKRIILTESIIDAASLLQIEALKMFEVLALFGTNGFTVEHQGALKNCPNLEEIVLLFDGDSAGAAASEKYKKELALLLPGVTIKIIELPNNTDVNELWANHLSEEMFLELLQTEALKNLPTKLDTSDGATLRYQGKTAKYYIKGLGEKNGLDSLQVRLFCENKKGLKYRSKLELYEDKDVQKYCKLAAEKLNLEASELDLDMSLLIDELDQYRSLQTDENYPSRSAKGAALSPKAKAAGLDFLKEDNLFFRLNELIGKTGIVGEENTRMLLLIVASSYKCKDPLHALIQGSTGTGKTLLLRKIMDLIPEAQRHIWTRITDKSLYHAGRQYEHSSIAIEDWDGLSEEVQYIVREFQSGHILRSSTTEKLPDGRMSSKEIFAYGPIASLMCTTHGTVYEDNMSRCLLVAVDESEEQTQRILDYQYKKDRGEIDKKSEEQATLFIQNLVQILEPLEVVNPFAGLVKLPPRVHKIRRLNQLFQAFVKQLVWWHQFQRDRDQQGRIIAKKEDVQLAIHLLFETIILKVDELDGSLRQFYEELKNYVLEQKDGEKYRFSRLEIRQALSLSKSQIERNLRQLLELEYIKQMGGYANKGFVYQIEYWDDNKALRLEIQKFMQDQLKLL